MPSRTLASAAPAGTLLGLAAVLFALAACDSPPAASGLPEWNAADHDHAEETARAATQGPGPGGSASPRAAGGRGPDPILEATWAQQCAPCHGPIGHGDGPTGPMVHAADLTLDDFQAKVTDAELGSAIVSGKGKMPAFASLPPKIVSGLVARIRASRGH